MFSLGFNLQKVQMQPLQRYTTLQQFLQNTRNLFAQISSFCAACRGAILRLQQWVRLTLPKHSLDKCQLMHDQNIRIRTRISGQDQNQDQARGNAVPPRSRSASSLWPLTKQCMTRTRTSIKIRIKISIRIKTRICIIICIRNRVRLTPPKRDLQALFLATCQAMHDQCVIFCA